MLLVEDPNPGQQGLKPGAESLNEGGETVVEDPNPGQQGLKRRAPVMGFAKIEKVEDPNPGQQGLKPQYRPTPPQPMAKLRTRIQDNKD